MIKSVGTQFIAGILLGSVSLRAQYVVDENNGILLPGQTVTLTGDTSSAGGTERDAAGSHFSVTDIGGNWGRERIFQIELTEPALLEVESVSQTGDPDYILLAGLDVFDFPAAGKTFAGSARAFTGLDGAMGSREELWGCSPGTYYLAVENFDGYDLVSGPVPKEDASFTTLLHASTPQAVDLSLKGGVVAMAGGPVYFGTNGSGMDTVMAIYRMEDSGVLVASNDDGFGTTESELYFEEGLPAGEYFVAVGGAGTVFEEDFAFQAGSTEGAVVLNYSQGRFYAPVSMNGEIDLSFEATSVQFYRFVIGEPPSSFELGTLAGGGEAFSLSLLNSTTLPDSEMALYDDQGFWLSLNDDYDGTTFLSRLDLMNLPEGVYYLAVTGWDHFFQNGFVTDVLQGGTTIGDYRLDFPGGHQNGALGPAQVDWFRFELGEAGSATGEITLSDFSLDTVNGEVTLAWEAQEGVRYRIFAGARLEELSLVPGQAGLSSGGATFPFEHAENPRHFFQVRSE